MAILAYQVTGFAYQGVGYFAYQGSVDLPSQGGGDSGRRRLHEKKKKRETVVRWADFATSEERRIALAQSLALASEPIKAIEQDSEEDSIIEDEDALITALVMSRIIH